MGLFQVVCMCLLAAIAQTQVLQDCSVDTSPVMVASTEDAAALATSILGCSNGDFAVEWVGEVVVEEAIVVTGGTSLNIAGAGPGAIADGGGSTQLFYVEGGSSLHLSDMIFTNGYATYGGAVFANQSSVLSLTVNLSFISNYAGEDGGAIYATESIVSWDGDGIEFSSNYANNSGGAIYAISNSFVSWDGDSTHFSSNSARTSGGAIAAGDGSTVSWDGDDTEFSSNSAGNSGGAIVVAYGSTVSWNGDGTRFSTNSADLLGGAIAAAYGSTVSWDVDNTKFISNSAVDGHGGAIIALLNSSVSWDGDGTEFISNSAYGSGGAIKAEDSSTVSWNGNGTEFISNFAGASGSAIYAQHSSTVSWNGDSTQFRSNHALLYGGAILVYDSSTVSWNGDGTQFVSNFAEMGGGAIEAWGSSTVSWDGDSTLFSFNSVDARGGAIKAEDLSTVSWNGDGTKFISNSAADSGGAIDADDSNVSWNGYGTVFSNNSATWTYADGGAINAYDSTVSWVGDGTEFVFNFAYEGGAIRAYDSNVSWDGDGTAFSNNSAADDGSGGAISASYSSSVSWDGDGTEFVSNSAESYGGAIFVVASSSVSWYGDGTAFISNFGDGGRDGGAISAYNSNVSWDGDGTVFRNNSIGAGTSSLGAGGGGGAIGASSSTVSWVGDGTEFTSNFAGAGGAIDATDSSNVSWDGQGTAFSNNSAADNDGGAISALSSSVSWYGGTGFISNSARFDGGAIYAGESTIVFLDVNTTFSGNAAGENGGALALRDLDLENMPFIGTAFINNTAGSGGGAVYIVNCVLGLNFTDVTFKSNLASGAGGAVAAYVAGAADRPSYSLEFSRCFFSKNKAPLGGAVEALLGKQEFVSCEFEGNSADVGGALRLGGVGDIHDCSFLSNSASARGLAITAVVQSVNISGSSFDGNSVYCASGSYHEDAEEEDSAARFETVCFDCPAWNACSGCSITRGSVTPTCVGPLEHTTADADGVNLETLNIDGGYWRTTTESDNILACYNPDACSGGITGANSFCASGYKGPYCAVCEADYSPSLAHTCTRCSSSRRQGLVAATVIAALVAVFAVATIFKFLLSTEVEEDIIGCFRRRVLRAVPVQALKIIVVVWQILTQFADAANVTYPGVYQDVLSAIDVVNFDLGSVLAAGCLWSGVDFHSRLLVSTIGPLVVVGFLAVTYQIAVRRNRASIDAAVAENILHKHQTALLLVTFLLYSSVSSMVFQTFACETLDDGIEYLRADYRIHCTDAKHKAFEVYAGFMVFVYPVGIPLLYAAMLFQRRDVLADADADKTVAQPIAGLWEAYRPERFYYEVIECGRRILLTGVVVFIFPNTAAQIAITMLIAFFFFAVFEVLSPYASESDTWLSRGGHVIVFLSMFDLLLLKVDVSGERDQSQAAFAGVLVAGHVLMILAIVVEVIALCYASRKKKVVEGEEASERPRVGSDDVPAFESAPASWRSFFRQCSVSEKTGPTRSVSGNLVTTGGP